MEKIRQQVAINTDEIKKLSEIEKIRPDMQNYSISKKVHVAQQIIGHSKIETTAKYIYSMEAKNREQKIIEKAFNSI